MIKHKINWMIFFAAILELCVIAGFVLYILISVGNRKIEIYAVHHKPWMIYRNDIVIPILGGRVLDVARAKPIRNLMIGDDTGENISAKNKNFAELTVLYWMWKNSKADYVGLMHYRRYFNLASTSSFQTNCLLNDVLCNLGLNRENVSYLMQNYDIIVTSYEIDIPNYNYYTRWHFVENLDLALDYVRQHYPKEAKYIGDVMMSKHLIAYNMFIGKKKIIDRYAEWLFDILFHIEDQLSFDHDKAYFGAVIPRHPTYQLRAPGFIAERLFDIWLAAHKDEYKIKEFPVRHIKYVRKYPVASPTKLNKEQR